MGTPVTCYGNFPRGTDLGAHRPDSSPGSPLNSPEGHAKSLGQQSQ
jgi:hypothetical protein